MAKLETEGVKGKVGGPDQKSRVERYRLNEFVSFVAAISNRL